ncbi:Hypothetical predicted protein [Mytilus galloprovincialis]|uniref:Uncharacterized protein n=1 Tax=Mytilus galloprovincialis TaxID=29158 RepID=A0A8B6CNH0_MYTGA|nr:Hypothetical predicted protein [Mytilus galloprovincialis]
MRPRSIKVKLWREKASMTNGFSVGDKIVVKNLKVMEFRGSIFLNSMSDTKIMQKEVKRRSLTKDRENDKKIISVKLAEVQCLFPTQHPNTSPVVILYWRVMLSVLRYLSPAHRACVALDEYQGNNGPSYDLCQANSRFCQCRRLPFVKL